MKKYYAFLTLVLTCVFAGAQPIINSWMMNVNGKYASYWATSNSQPPSYTFTNTTDSADVLRVCYNADTVWVYSQNMTDNMGKWFNPGSPVAQDWVHRFPRTPVVPSSKTISPKVGEIGMLLNGIAIYGLSNANSWTGSTNGNPQQGGLGIWNVEVGISEGFVLDTAFGAHPQQQGVYHSHTTPFRLYRNSPSNVHSPLIGWAFDGYPIYGPYGYDSPMDSTSSIARMKTGFSLRNITTRTSLPDGTTATQAGPPVNATYPIGTYCEDYEWLASNGGHLDEHNGRMCVTPDFPQGTYAYFVTIDAAGEAAFPYYVGITYYGKPDAGNFPAGPNGNGLSIPAYLSSCRLPSGSPQTGIGVYSINEKLSVYPNPADNGTFTISNKGKVLKSVTVLNSIGQRVYASSLINANDHIITLAVPEGVYLVVGEEPNGTTAIARIIVK